MKVKYRNTGFTRQIFVYYKKRYHGIEAGKRYVRYYRLTPIGSATRFKEVRL